LPADEYKRTRARRGPTAEAPGRVSGRQPGGWMAGLASH
jgi:hypothetical protein